MGMGVPIARFIVTPLMGEPNRKRSQIRQGGAIPNVGLFEIKLELATLQER